MAEAFWRGSFDHWKDHSDQSASLRNCWCRPRGFSRLQERIAVRAMDTGWHGFAGLGRWVGGRREVAIRLWMGASRWRLVLQLMVENGMIAMAGGGLALLLTTWTAHGMPAFLPTTNLPLTMNGSVDGTVLLATIMISLLTAAVSGVLPALRASSLSPMSALK